MIFMQYVKNSSSSLKQEINASKIFNVFSLNFYGNEDRELMGQQFK